QAEDGIRDDLVTGVQTCALPIWRSTPVERLECVHDVRRGRRTVEVREDPRPVSQRGSDEECERCHDCGQDGDPPTPTRCRSETRSEERRVGKEWRGAGWEREARG